MLIFKLIKYNNQDDSYLNINKMFQNKKKNACNNQ